MSPSFPSCLEKRLLRMLCLSRCSHAPFWIELAPAAHAEADVPAVRRQHQRPTFSYWPEPVAAGKHRPGNSKKERKRWQWVQLLLNADFIILFLQDYVLAVILRCTHIRATSSHLEVYRWHFRIRASYYFFCFRPLPSLPLCHPVSHCARPVSMACKEICFVILWRVL